MATQRGSPRHRGRHRRARHRRAPAVVLGVVAVVAIIVAVSAYLVHGGHRSPAANAASHSASAPTTDASTRESASARPVAAPAPVTASHSSAAPSGPPPVLTRGGMWWGVDSTEPISRSTIANVAGWYRGARPQFWGRYLSGDYGVTRHELAFARARHIYVFLIVNDRNCSGCAGGDACGNDRTTAQAHDDARAAIRRAGELGVPTGAVLFKDIEQVSSCRGEPTSDYLLGWYRTVLHTKYRTGFYGNTFRPYYDFPVGYCHAVSASSRFAADVVLDMNEPEPAIGAPQGTTGPHDAPAFAPSEPPCTPAGRTVIWQYGESLEAGNLTDIDQARPATHGLLAPDGSAT